MNSAVGPIFNEKVTEKWNLWVREQCMDTLFIVKKSTQFSVKSKLHLRVHFMEHAYHKHVSEYVGFTTTCL